MLRRTTPTRVKIRLVSANLLVGPGPTAGSFPLGKGFAILHITPDPLVITQKHADKTRTELEDLGQGHRSNTAATHLLNNTKLGRDTVIAKKQYEHCGQQQ